MRTEQVVTRRTVQFPTFPATVAEQMADYRARIAERIRIELARRGEGPNDLAYAVGVDKRTVERWEAAERQPQGRHLKAVADYFGISIEELRPDLELEEKTFRDQLDRIEAEVAATRVEIGALSTQLADLQRTLARLSRTSASKSPSRKAK